MSGFLIAMTVCSVSLIGAAKLTAVVIQPQEASVNAGQIDSSATVVRKSVRIRGIVIGPDEQKITGAELYVNVNEYQDSIKLGKSDADGAFQFEVPHETLKRLVSPGVFLGQCQVSLVAVADGYGAAWEFLPSEKGGRFGDMKAEYEVRLQMVEDLPIKGHIVDDAGKAVVVR